MDANDFDRLTRIVSTALSRRELAGALGLAALATPSHIDAKKKQRKRRHKRKKQRTIERNDFGCVDVGTFCTSDAQCCSGICEGKKGKQTCQDHDTGGCTGEQDICAGVVLVPCETATGEEGACERTTGNAGYCGAGGACFSCARDADCQASCGPRAACIICESLCGPNGTACVGPTVGTCGLPE